MSSPIKVDDAFKGSNLKELKAALGNPADFSNTRLDGTNAYCLEYAIYHSPVSLIRSLLELGANPNYEDAAGFPSLIAALSSERSDKREIIELLISFGADLQQRGINGWTPLHFAAAGNDAPAVSLLLSHGANRTARTNVDDFNTPLEEAEQLGCSDAVRVLRASKVE
jgi:uncharacterized protein